MRCFFVRHGQTNYNIAQLCNDNPARDVHLTEQGIQQAQLVAEKLRDVELDRILVSPLPRTRQTAEIINRYHQLDIEPHKDVADIRSGFDGQPVATYQQAISRDRIQDRLSARANGGESLLDHEQRVTAFLHWLKAQPQKNVLVVAHEETLRVVTGFFQQLDDAEMIDLHIDNGEVLEFQFP